MILRTAVCALGALCASLSSVAYAADPQGARGLLADVDRIVAGEESEGWFADSDALREIEPAIFESMCRATPDARAEALRSLQAASAGAGDPRALFASAGRMTDEVQHALSLQRQHRALEQALARADAECPFWVRPAPGFKGRQSDRQRFTLSLETAGNVQLRRTLGRFAFGAGGWGRILPGYGINENLTLLAGAELGGGAMVKPNTGASQFIINYFPAIPVLLRVHHRTWHYDLEAAPVALFQADNTALSYGFRVGGGFGFSALRRHDFLPWAGVALSYEHYFEGGGRAAAEFLRADLRVGFVWDPN
ncbi:MAG TPA: hypothetical protein VGL19_04050 [Polyangiaceae bacterium]|jgi:hypothetical protein